MTINGTAEHELLSGKHLYLAGYRGSGKSSVGRLLAQKLGRTWIDCDDEIEATAACSIREIFAAGGEDAFRELEETVIAKIAQRTPAVVSLGGGAILRQTNRSLIAGSGVCIWLQVDAQTVLTRLAEDQTTAARRPALTGLPPLEEIEQLLADRRPLYDEVADLRIDTSRQSVDTIVEQILQYLGLPQSIEK
jgi:shikimate kinase